MSTTTTTTTTTANIAANIAALHWALAARFGHGWTNHTTAAEWAALVAAGGFDAAAALVRERMDLASREIGWDQGLAPTLAHTSGTGRWVWRVDHDTITVEIRRPQGLAVRAVIDCHGTANLSVFPCAEERHIDMARDELTFSGFNVVGVDRTFEAGEPVRLARRTMRDPIAFDEAAMAGAPPSATPRPMADRW